MPTRHRPGKEPADEAGPSRPVVEDPLSDSDVEEDVGDEAAPRRGYFETFATSGVGLSLRGTMTVPEPRIASLRVVDTPLLTRLRSHPSVYLRAQIVPPIRPFRGAWFQAVEICNRAHRVFREFLAFQGFGDFLSIPPFRTRHSLVSALAERWFSETNTLHLGDCEVGVTPLEWAAITGLRFGGVPVQRTEGTVEDLSRVLGIHRYELHGSRIPASVLRGGAYFYTEEVFGEDLYQRCRRLLLLLIVSCFLSNNGSLFPASYVGMVDFPDGHRFDWGSFTFATFLQAMRRRVSCPSPTQLGFWPFLLWWSYEHFSVGRPQFIGREYLTPRALQWPRPSPRALDLMDFVTMRSQLELVTPDQIVWQPFGVLLEDDTYALEVYLSSRRYTFYSFTSWELYMGDHCWRQTMGEIRIPMYPSMATFGQAWSRSGGIIEIDGHMIEGDYDGWFRSVSIGRFTTTIAVRGGRSIGAEQDRFYQRMGGAGHGPQFPQPGFAERDPGGPSGQQPPHDQDAPDPPRGSVDRRARRRSSRSDRRNRDV